jgi:HEAT repeat protein
MADADEWEAVRGALRSAGVDPTDLGRFVNRPNPDLLGLEPDTFDAKAAYPVLLEWLPRVESPSLRSTIASRLRAVGKSAVTARALITAYRAETNEDARWQLGDAIARTAPAAELDEIVELAADPCGGTGRQMLVYALWRVKTDRARSLILELLRDPDVCVHAMHSLRRAFGNEEARRRIEPLLEDENERVRDVARHTLTKIDRALAR